MSKDYRSHLTGHHLSGLRRVALPLLSVFAFPIAFMHEIDGVGAHHRDGQMGSNTELMRS